jgi:hypothetical protein
MKNEFRWIFDAHGKIGPLGTLLEKPALSARFDTLFFCTSASNLELVNMQKISRGRYDSAKNIVIERIEVKWFLNVFRLIQFWVPWLQCRLGKATRSPSQVIVKRCMVMLKFISAHSVSCHSGTHTYSCTVKPMSVCGMFSARIEARIHFENRRRTGNDDEMYIENVCVRCCSSILTCRSVSQEWELSI